MPCPAISHDYVSLFEHSPQPRCLYCLGGTKWHMSSGVLQQVTSPLSSAVLSPADHLLQQLLCLRTLPQSGSSPL